MSIKSADEKAIATSQGISISLSRKSKPLVETQAPEPAKVDAKDDHDEDDEDLSDLEDVVELDSDSQETDDTELQLDDDEDEALGDRKTAEAVIADNDALDLDSDTVDNGLVMIFKPKCLECGHLVPHVKQKYKSCHFSKGNTQCPASGVQILIDIDLEPIVTAFVVSKKEGDNKRLARLYTQLATKPEWQQNRITTAVEKREAELLSSKKKK